MPIKINQIKRETPKFLGQDTPHLIGNVNDWIKTTINIQCSYKIQTSQSIFLNVSSTSINFTVLELLGQGTFKDEGMSINDAVDLNVFIEDSAPANAGNVVDRSFFRSEHGGADALITWMSPDGKTIHVDDHINNWDDTDFIGANRMFQTQRVENNQTGWLRAIVFKERPFDSIEVFYNMNSNAEKQSNSLFSLIDGSTTRFSYNNLNGNDSSQFGLTQFGFKSGGAIKSIKVQAIPNATTPNFNGAYFKGGGNLPNIDGTLSNQIPQFGDFITVFNVEIIHKIIGIEEDITDLENLDQPEWFLDANALGDNFLFKLYPQFSNQNIFVKSDMDSTLTSVNANTGWFDENYNARPTDITINRTEFFNIVGTPISVLDFGNETRVDIYVNTSIPIADARYTLSFEYRPNNETQYKSNAFSNVSNTISNTPLQNNSFNGVDLTGIFKTGVFYPTNIGNTHSSGARMDLNQVQITDEGGGVHKITFVSKPNNEFFAYLDGLAEDNRRYFISVGCTDINDAIEISNSTEVLANTDVMDFVPVPIGEWTLMSNLFNELPVPPNQVGATSYVGFVEDLILCQTRFQMDIAGGITFDKINPAIEIYNNVTGQVVPIDSVEIDLTNQIIDGLGIQQININGLRGFQVGTTNDKNFMNVYRLPNEDVGSVKAYMMQFGTRIRYEDWILNNDIPTDFFDALEQHDGLNNNWYTKQNTDWSLKYSVLSTVNRLGSVAVYKNSYPIEIKDYFQNGLDLYTEIRHYRESDNTSLFNGVIDGLDNNTILANAITKVEIDYILNVGIYPLGGIYAECNLEIFEGGGWKSIGTISTEYDPKTNSALIGNGNNGLRLELVSVSPTDIRSICFIDPQFLLGSATKYKVSGRIGCSTGNKLPNLPTGTPYNNKYNSKYL